MGKVVVTIKILPVSPDIKLEDVSVKAEEIIAKHGKLYKKSIQPIAFGISALNIAFIMDEGSIKPEAIEEELKKIDGVGDVQTGDVTKLVDVSFG